MRRRQFIRILGAAFATAPGVAFAQTDRVRIVGVLLSQSEGSKEAMQRVAAIREALQKLGWTDGGNLRIEARYAHGSAERMKAGATDLVRLRPDALIASATTSLSELQKATNSIPIVFAQVTDPVGAGFVKSLARPGGNITGFTQHDFSIGLKWLELLKELAPKTAHVGLIFDPNNPATAGYRTAIKGSASQFKVEISDYPVRSAGEIERAITEVGARSNSGFVVLPGPAPSVRADLVVGLASKHKIPAVYPFRYWIASGGLAFYGIDNIDLHRQTASYVSRILKGEKPGDLPVQNASKFQLVINLRVAKALGIEPPNSLVARTDEVIE
jgi:putative ABC transport system substrate-binding protein